MFLSVNVPLHDLVRVCYSHMEKYKNKSTRSYQRNVIIQFNMTDPKKHLKETISCESKDLGILR